MRRRLNWGTSIALVYGLFAVSTLGFVAFAMSQPVDLVSPDYYERALHEDDRIAALANARALGEGFRVTPDIAARSLRIDLPAATRPVNGTVTLYRPSDAAEDREQALAPRDGVQVVSLEGLRSGRWIAKLEWTANGAPYYYEMPFRVP